MKVDYIANGDCLKLIKDNIHDNSIDLTVTSPPYDNLRTYNDKVSWNFEIFQDLAKELYRITKQGGVVVWVVGDATINGSETGSSFRQALFLKDCGFNLHDTMIFQKSSLSHPNENRYFSVFEYMFVFSKGKPKTTNLIKDRYNKYVGLKIHGTRRNKKGELKKNNSKTIIKEFGVRTNIWTYDVGKWKSTKDHYIYEHPAVFPEKLVKDHIISWTNEGDIVFDPFLGSGTTAKIAILNKRHFIGFELVEEYFNIAYKRVEDAKKTCNLWLKNISS